MNKKPNVPDEIWLGKKEYSWRMDWRVNGWLFAAALSSCASDFLFPDSIRQWPVALRTLIALAPFLALLLWVRSLSQWIRGMDELHRRITLAAILFTTAATFFVVMIWHSLVQAVAFHSLLEGRNPQARWEIATIGHVFLLLTFFYFLGYSIFNRRFR